MNSEIFQPFQKISLLRLSNNAEVYTPEEGIFEVRCCRSKCFRFNTLVGAFLFYIDLKNEAGIYHISGEREKLVELKTFLN
jgi:hypothetical protein